MWRAYGGFSFEFNDYKNTKFMEHVDDPKAIEMFKIIDPDQYWDRLAQIPKYIVVSSDDEFMMMDWTELYWHQLPGEKHILILTDDNHGMRNNYQELLSVMSTFLRSIASGNDHTQRPTFE